MARLSLALLVLAACSGSSKVADSPQPPNPDARPPTAAELALDAHHDRLLDQPGVVNVRLDETGDGLIVDVCAPEILPDLNAVDVPASIVAGAWAETVQGEPCGCSEAGVYHPDGALIARDCNACTCHAGQIDACTELDCRLHATDRIQFTRNAAELDDDARAALDVLAQGLIANPSVRMILRGHADPKEISVAKLTKKRALAVRDYLVKAGVSKAQLTVEAKGNEAPLGGAAEADRRVELVVVE